MDSCHRLNRIEKQGDMQVFQSSPARAKLVDFIQGTCCSLMMNPDPAQRIEPMRIRSIERICEFLDIVYAELSTLNRVEATNTRFGDPRFRSWFQELERRVPDLIDDITPSGCEENREELCIYLCHSFGNSNRLDYGTGHELSFVAWLCCLELLGVSKVQYRSKIVYELFVRYLRITRRLQELFRLEPAGSRGAWGLDDFCFLPFLWGASQLQKSSSTPACILRKRVDLPGNLFYDSCTHVRKIKGDDLNIVSPTLASLSDVQTWSRVADGLFKMYCAECLDKFQIMQHFHFGRLLSLF